MIAKIDSEICIGCWVCVKVCPLDTLRMGDDKKAFIAYPDDCMICFICDCV